MEFVLLKRKIEERGIKKTVIAKKLKITERALRNKLEGKSRFTWEQVCVIQKEFFPDIEKDDLFKKYPDKAS